MQRRISPRPSRRRSVGRRLGVTAAFVALVVAPLSYASANPPAPDDDLWSPVDARPLVSDDLTPRVEPTEYEAFTLDGDAMEAQLDAAPSARSGSGQIVSVPAPNGELVDFAIAESPVLQSRLAAKHPEIRTYAGRGVTDPSATIRLDLTPTGFHASVRGASNQGAWYVDPAYNKPVTGKASNLYLSYLGSDLPKPDDGFSETDVEGVAQRLAPAPRSRAAGEVEMRTYRLALVNDPSYARYFGTENVLAEKTTLINRVNHVYNDDLAIRLVLANGSDKLNLDTMAKATKPNGPCGSQRCFHPVDLETCGGGTLDRNGVVIGQLIGARNYDVGHIALGVSGGGVAGLGVVGGPGKAVGCTGLPTPEGDYYAVDYVAHEMGHQFGGNHTFDGANGACSGGNRNPGTSVEPGSGSSVMAYAGICGGDDLQPHSDPYFSQRSIQEATAYVSSKRRKLSEIQTVSLRDFDAADDAFKLRTSEGTTAKIKHGKGFTVAKVQAALTKKLGAKSVKVTGWGDGLVKFGDKGFSVVFQGSRAGKNQQELEVVPTGGDVSGLVGETQHGGPNGNHGAVSATGNDAPSVDAPADKRLPVQTPFTLEASGSDDQDALTYSWEQNDRGKASGVALFKPKKLAGPLFRIFGRYANVTPAGTLQYESPGQNHTSDDPTRTFPDIKQVLAGNTNAGSGKCAESKGRRKTACYSEWLPTADFVGRKGDRKLHFRVTARDHFAEGGGTAHDDVTLTVAPKAGPLFVTSFGEPGEAVRGTRTQPVGWLVNGTNRPALAPRVRITLSTDGGKTFDTVLAESTKNDGTANVTWPNVDTKNARIKVEAVGNYFFAVNGADFEISAVQ
ncbi:M12 family metallo-peptidase [Solicola gregarius]|uniref:M12 family metallo-peptidase n=1 Tax=Solicola gregarius TaxID=2908642 RepID=A0AA46TFQ6_9ACTN|nr:M12 family metallo-peptidase [Solicola gregarius]UYM04024.1 M12 family metallo-peptidase [Solicola gregarius]